MQNTNPLPQDAAQPTPERIGQIAWSFTSLFSLASALDLRLFKHVADGRVTLSDLEAATGASRRGLEMLLNAMVGLRFLTREGDGEAARFGLTPEAAAFLVEGRPGYHGGFVQLSAYRMIDTWEKLTECVRTGKPVMAVEKPEEGVPLWIELVDNLFPLNYPAGRSAAQELRRLYPGQALRVLDVAAGSGVWGIAAAHEDPGTRVVAFDLPETLEQTRRMAERHGVADRIELRPGDIRRDNLGEAEFDAVILGHICHSEGAEHSRRLLAKAARALKPGGTLIIAEMVPDDDRRGPAFPLLFAVNMLIHTSEGNTFTFAEYDAWLREAGFRDTRRLPTPSPSPLILATR